jgi:hypothetical protein
MQEIADLEVLRWRLGNPATILCLGNGPSSESRAIPQDFDSLFRVNWNWRDRGFLSEPDVVFTGDPDLPPPESRAIVGFPSHAEAQRILRGYQAPAAWFAVPRLLQDFVPQRHAFVPTNGALMIAVGVALAPRRLVISGIDLYSHPQGKYPGTVDDLNVYDAAHSRDTDVAFILAALSRYRGEQLILSEHLREALS